MYKSYSSRYTILLIIIAFYLLPIMLLSSYGRLYMPVQKGWNLLAFGIFCSSIGLLGIFWMMCRLSHKAEHGTRDTHLSALEASEFSPKQSNIVELDMTQAKALEDLQEQHNELHEHVLAVQKDLEAKTKELLEREQNNQHLQEKLSASAAEYEMSKQAYESALDQQKLLLVDSQKTITEQRECIDKKLQQIAQLEIKVSDLTYEIKTLIQLAEIENQSMPIYSSLPLEQAGSIYPPLSDIFEEEISCLPEKKVRNSIQANIQLKRCIDIAQKITGASHYYNTSSRFKDLAVDNYTLDLRRLFDSLRAENASAIIFYSQKENKILFVNNQCRSLLGWSPDKFVQSFNEIVEPSKDIWRQGIASLAIKNDNHISLKMKSKAGAQVEVHALLGIIPTGIFRYHVLGVLYSSLS
ncbi:hypothetical protein [Neochlamydia sp. EPS4]|uniref:hypothetical protein n=1 Tax=Neochlamydia sp. EPS4 TaxID=1478175 RepID=UPI0012BAEA7F|nr:hypothetical protein [Neochlamydia sp. EPS4]